MDSREHKRALNQVPSSSASGRIGNFGLVRECSIYSLTLEEFQNSLGGHGKSVGSMNMDELLRNIWAADEIVGEIGDVESGLVKQGSLTLPRTLSRKTVDEVWKDINKESVTNANGNGNGTHNPPRQVTFSEMTLEDFLAKAGVVKEENVDPNVVHGESSVTMDNCQFHNPNSGAGGALSFPDGRENEENQLSREIRHRAMNLDGFDASDAQPDFFGNPYSELYGSPGLIANGYEGAGHASPSSRMHLDKVNDSGSPVSYPMDMYPMDRRARISAERTVEKRQRRMIKNRESAARSRARKQAYTVELEAEVSQLKEENNILRRKQEEMAQRRKRQFMNLICHLTVLDLRA
eukprot:TRINITY_DN3848_c0_g1_i4.p1 TRINITY_DN3848_c0_g1~~TRINITY_DN3848_c0_g1_i4.p1  ORF type:complete len:350 (-),score=68.35 TRINITY_DN3848_c0_g1_i4:469-1518(-)